MKILPRKIANEVIQDKKRQQIDEGLLIAKKVDALRGSLLELENQRAYFIEQTSSAINIATSQVYQDKQELENEIKDLEKQRKKLQEPLDKEWKKVDEEQELISKQWKQLVTNQEDFKNREINLKNKESEYEKRERNNTLTQNEFEKLLWEAQEEKQEADDILQEAQESVSLTEKDISKRISEILIKEEKVSFDLKANQQVAFLNELKEEELRKREISVNDKYVQLLKTIQEVNGKRKN